MTVKGYYSGQSQTIMRSGCLFVGLVAK